MSGDLSSSRPPAASTVHRIDGSHPQRVSCARSVVGNSEPAWNSIEVLFEREAKLAAPRFGHLVFFLLVFLFGQFLTVGAFLAGHFGAWVVGLSCSTFGLFFAVCVVGGQISQLNRRMTSAQLGRTVAGASLPACSDNRPVRTRNVVES